MQDLIRELIADGHSQFRVSARLQAIAKRLKDDQLTRAVEALEGNRAARCANMQALAHAAATPEKLGWAVSGSNRIIGFTA